MSIEVVTEVDADRWDDFLQHASRANIFHTRQFLDSFRRADRYVPYTFFLVEDVRIVAMIASVQTKIMGDVFPRFSSRSVVYGGVLLADDLTTTYIRKHLGQLIDAYDEVLRKCTVYSEVRNVSDPTPMTLAMTHRQHRLVPHLNYLIDLTPGEEAVWDAVTAKRRRIVKRAIDKLTIVQASTESHVDIFSDLVRQTYSRVRTPCFEREVFQNVWKQLAPLGHIRINLAEYEGRHVATVAVLVYKGRSYEWFAASNREGDQLDANSALLWDAIKWSANNGCSLFDFGGAGDPNKPYPVRDFKARFRGDLVNYGRFVKIYSPWRYRLSAAGYAVLRRVLFR